MSALTYSQNKRGSISISAKRKNKIDMLTLELSNTLNVPVSKSETINSVIDSMEIIPLETIISQVISNRTPNNKK